MMEKGVIWKRILIGLLCIVQVIVVNSFLHKADIELIERHLQSVPKDGKAIRHGGEEIEDTVMKINRYGEAVILHSNPSRHRRQKRLFAQA